MMNVQNGNLVLDSFDDLYKKENKAIQEIYKTSIEYLFNQLFIVLSKPSILSKASLEEIKLKHPKFSLGNFIIYPIFLALSNGNSKSLFNLFSPFVYVSGIPISLSLIDQIRSAKKNSQYLEHYKISDLNNLINLKPKDESKELSLDEIRQSLLNVNISISTTMVSFKSCYVLNDKNVRQPLYSAIESAFTALLNQSSGKFFELSFEELKFQSSFFNSSSIANHDGKTFDFVEVEKESRRPFFENAVI